jgi:membrane protein DedA with SNARE-associated domain
MEVIASTYARGVDRVNQVLANGDWRAVFAAAAAAALLGSTILFRGLGRWVKSRVLSKKRRNKREQCRQAIRELRERLHNTTPVSLYTTP